MLSLGVCVLRCVYNADVERALSVNYSQHWQLLGVVLRL